MSRIVVVMPTGPGRPEEFVNDTAQSFVQFMPDARYIVLDDSQSGLGERLALPNKTVMVNPGEPGRLGLLYRRLSHGYAEGLTQPFDLLMRIDDDAVLLGGQWIDQARELFAQNPRLGQIGLHERGYLGELRSFDRSAQRLNRLLRGKEARADPARTLRLWGLYRRARRNGYFPGESILGAIAIWRPEALRAVEQAGVLADPRLVRAHMSEDQLLGLGLRAAGFTMQGFGDGNDELPLAAAWRGLPAAPDEIVAAGKELVHSVKSWARRDEAEVRAVFARARAGRAA